MVVPIAVSNVVANAVASTVFVVFVLITVPSCLVLCVICFDFVCFNCSYRFLVGLLLSPGFLPTSSCQRRCSTSSASPTYFIYISYISAASFTSPT